MNDDDLDELGISIVERCRDQGCTCNVVAIYGETSPGIWWCKAEHDDDCPLWRRLVRSWN